ncbi:MAG TPA: TIGR03619 family F420-dependent LLM class oxidoreductase [Streptosporangiaceae bacterium]|nr:TIGR03619 family F420-dependent LLM class oxidoreductase [Streptosporangiaceae bacterium]
MEFWLGAAFAPTDELPGLARAADRLGYDTVALSDHIFYADYEADYPYHDAGEPPYAPETHWPDVWVMAGALAAITERVRLATNVYVAPARDLFTVAKTVSTAAVLSGGRVRFGVGVGWCKDEFVQTGQDFHTRGRRLDEMIPALRTLWQGGMVEHKGDFYEFGPLRIEPVPDHPVPIYIGGDSDAALRRAARIGDGWIGNRVYSERKLAAVLDRLSGFLAEYGRTLDDLAVIAPIAAMPSPDLYKKWADRGVTGTMAAPWLLATPDEQSRHTGLDLKIATMERFATEVIAKM